MEARLEIEMCTKNQTFSLETSSQQSSIANEYQEEGDGYRYKMPSLLEIE
jgi:hypothetical protein